ncbi:MAG: 30S ribosomal protein S19e [Halobacteriaceae archaeon]
MVTLYDAPTDALLDEVASRLAERSEVDAPDWEPFAKSGAGRELPPEQDDFWERRVASVLRKVAVNGPVGVQRLRTEYGDKTAGTVRYRVMPDRRSDASGSVIRTALQQLEAAGLVEQAGSAGRRVTDEGRSLLDSAAGDALREVDRPDLERYV